MNQFSNQTKRTGQPGDGRKKTVILTFDDAVKSHLSNVAPILNEYGFGATFFICRFNEDWRSQHSSHLLTLDEIKQLADMGFEIGNHTINHPDLRTCSDAECQSELAGLNDYLQSGDIKQPVSFAYPGGPFADNAVPVLKLNGIKMARTTEPRAWDQQRDSPFQIPSFPLQNDDELAFFQTLSHCREDHAVVLVFHGVPDLVHGFVSTSVSFFSQCMKYLNDHDYRVISLVDSLKDQSFVIGHSADGH